MTLKLDGYESSLKEQLSRLASQIRTAESDLITLKEGYLKVQGALELLGVLVKDLEENEVATDMSKMTDKEAIATAVQVI